MDYHSFPDLQREFLRAKFNTGTFSETTGPGKKSHENFKMALHVFISFPRESYSLGITTNVTLRWNFHVDRRYIQLWEVEKKKKRKTRRKVWCVCVRKRETKGEEAPKRKVLSIVFDLIIKFGNDSQLDCVILFKVASQVILRSIKNRHGNKSVCNTFSFQNAIPQDSFQSPWSRHVTFQVFEISWLLKEMWWQE